MNREAPALTLAELSEMTCTGIYDEPITLSNGIYEGEPFVVSGSSRPTVTLIKQLWLAGELGGEPGDKAVVLLAESSGGSGSNLYVSVVARRDGHLMSLATALVGDRPQVRSMRIEQGVIVLDLVQVGHNDAACCASELATRRWELKGTELIERDGEISGTLSLAVLRGTRWELDAWGFGNEQSALIEQLPTIMFEDGRVSGFGGCNRYFGSVTEEAPGELRFGPLAATKMACIGDAGTTEDRFLQRLQASERFSFWLGQLALDWHDDEGAGTLLFKLTEDAISPAS